MQLARLRQLEQKLTRLRFWLPGPDFAAFAYRAATDDQKLFDEREIASINLAPVFERDG